jgi:N-acetylmuramoyl-L-alanine amidase
MAVVVLDPGHGGKDPGGCGNGLKEKDIVLDVALRTSSMLKERGVDVVLTRDKDVYVGITDRHVLATNAKANLFVSIHCDAYYSPAHGFSILFYKAASRDGIGLLMKDELLSIYDDWNRWIYGYYVGVLVHATMPAILTENLFVTNTVNAQLLKQDSFRQNLAEAHSKAICRYFNIPYYQGEGSDENMAIYPLQLMVDEEGKPIKDGEYFVWGGFDGFTRNVMFSMIDCWLNVYNENELPVEIKVWVNYDESKEKWPVSIPVGGWKRSSTNLENLVGGSKGFSIIVKCTSLKIFPGITLLCK